MKIEPSFSDNIQYLKGVGPKKAILFHKLGIYTRRDLLYYFPIRYDDRRQQRTIKELEEGKSSLIKVKVLARTLRRITYRRSIFEVALTDGEGVVYAVWFNQPYLVENIHVGDELVIYGKPSKYKRRLQFNAPLFEKIDKTDAKENNFLDLGRIVGVYRITEGISQKVLRKTIYHAWKELKVINDPLPFYIRREKGIPNIKESLKGIHFPDSFEEAYKCRERFIFEELFLSQIQVYLRKARHRMQKGIAFKINRLVMVKIKDNLGFELTSAQKKVIDQIINDMSKPYPMHRLLQGDVGCGKTVVSSFALGICVDNRYQAAFMVPTEVLARQHYSTLQQIFKNLGFKISLLTGSLPAKKKNKILKDLVGGKIDIVVGTHSLIEEEVKFKRLGLVVIDEQHKFGVAQRALLPQKGDNPDCLIMSATPIPRSLALSIYGDLDLSVIDQLPKGRKTPKTLLMCDDQRDDLYKLLRQELKNGRQVYFVYPVIEEDIDLELKSVEIMYKKLREEFKGEFNVGMFHGRMKSKEKEEVIERFKYNKINILVCTTVIEVGINIENATVMVVENPERFGLSQLHQLRGRIRRSVYQPYFILMMSKDISELAYKRLNVISKVNDGFKIAEADLVLRGPGDFFGHYQHGFPDLKIANPLRDLDILKSARIYAYKAVKSDPFLEKKEHKYIREYIGDTFFNNYRG